MQLNFSLLPKPLPSSPINSHNNIMAGMWGKGTLRNCWWECKLV